MDKPVTIWIAKVDTRYEWVAVDTDPDAAIAAACEAAYEWLVEVGVTEHESPAAVREYFDVVAVALPVGTAVQPHRQNHHR